MNNRIRVKKILTKASKAISEKKVLPLTLNKVATPEEKIAADPLGYYSLFKKRLDKNGILAPFPEFKEPVDYLLQALQNSSVIETVKEHKALENQYFQTKNNLFHLKFNFKIEGEAYPHIPPFSAPYAYLPTILQIEQTLGFIDSCYRARYDNLPPLYHVNRYKYHTYGFYQYHKRVNPFILYPTIQNLKLDNFISTRAVPFGFVGVSAEAVFADAYFNSPLDFFIHDINHVRRFKSYNDLYRMNNKISQYAMSRQFYKFITTIILPSIKMTDDITIEEKYIRQILKILYFELLHEYAFTPDRQSLINAFLHQPESASPFEHMVNEKFDPETLESQLRMPNNNIKSGFDFVENKFKKVIIRYFFDKGPNFLTSAYNKVINGFYDSHLDRDVDLPPIKERTPELFAKAAQRILSAIEATETISKEEILSHIQHEGFIEKYPNLILKQPNPKSENVNKTKEIKKSIDKVSLFKLKQNEDLKDTIKGKSCKP